MDLPRSTLNVTQPAATHSSSETWRSRSAWGWLVGTTLITVALDLATKVWAFAKVAQQPVTIRREDVLAAAPEIWRVLPAHEPVVAIPKVLNFSLVVNPGAVFGMGAGKRWFFIVFTLGAVCAGLWMFAHWTRARDRAAHFALGCILGGGLGNLYDRVRFACVRDFIHPLPGVKLPGGLSWPWGGNEVWPYVSNVADAILILGVVILAWKSLRGQHAGETPKPNAAQP